MSVAEFFRSRKHLAAQFLYGMLWVGITGVAIALHPDPQGHGTHTQLGLPPCPSVLLFSRPCPGCGLTTSFTAMVHGDFALAFRAHALGPILYGIFTLTALVALVKFFRGRHFETNTRPWLVGIYTGLVIFVGYGLFRLATQDDYRGTFEDVARAVSVE